MPKRRNSEELESLCTAIWGIICISLTITGLAVKLVADHPDSKIFIAHICLGIITAFLFMPLVFCGIRDDSSERVALVSLLDCCVWLTLLIVLVSDSAVRQEVNSEGQQYFNQTAKRTILESAAEIGLGSGTTLGVVIMDALNVLFNSLAMIATCYLSA